MVLQLLLASSAQMEQLGQVVQIYCLHGLWARADCWLTRRCHLPSAPMRDSAVTRSALALVVQSGWLQYRACTCPSCRLLSSLIKKHTQPSVCVEAAPNFFSHQISAELSAWLQLLLHGSVVASFSTKFTFLLCRASWLLRSIQSWNSKTSTGNPKS